MHLMELICHCAILTPLIYHCYMQLAFLLGIAKNVFIYSAQNYTYILCCNCLIRIDMMWVPIFFYLQAFPLFLDITYNAAGLATDSVSIPNRICKKKTGFVPTENMILHCEQASNFLMCQAQTLRWKYRWQDWPTGGELVLCSWHRLYDIVALQTTFWNVYCWMKIIVLIFIFHCSLFMKALYVTLMAITRITIMIPYHPGKSLQLLWGSGTCRFHLQVSHLHMACWYFDWLYDRLKGY